MSAQRDDFAGPDSLTDKLGRVMRPVHAGASLPARRPAIYPNLPPMPPFTSYESREKTVLAYHSPA
jgi:hypothetical protein